MSDWPRSVEPKHSREDLQRILYEICVHYREAKRSMGGDSEFVANRVEIAERMLKENDWWPS